VEIVEIAGTELLARTRSALGLPTTATGHIDEQLIAALLRRAAGTLCPCSASTLVSAVADSLDCLSPEPASLSAAIETVLEKLVVGGDLLELHQVTTDDAAAKGTWLFAAPPAFISRAASGSAFLIGVASDDSAPIPDSLKARIRYEGCVRVIAQDAGHDLAEELREHGLVELSEQSWLKLPKVEPATAFRDRMERLLREQPPSGDVPDLQILDGARDPAFYRGRWMRPRKESGCFVARRPQAYGAPIWGFALLASGELARFLDFPLKSSKWRGCDLAWHLQMAIDHCRGAPQRYRKHAVTDGVIFDFFSPLPLWAERRLALIGRAADRSQSLLSYFVTNREVQTEERFLHDRLWLSPSADADKET